LASILPTGTRLDHSARGELAQYAAKGLLGDAEGLQECADRLVRLSRDEIERPMMGAAHALLGKALIGLLVKMAIAEEEQLGTAANLGFTEEKGGSGRDSHIDLI
jgi:hypothetical protein